MSIDGKVVLVTGAGQGIGRAIALRLARDGADVALVDVKDEQTSAVESEVRAIGRKATSFVADVSKRDQVFAAVDHAERELGGFDVMITQERFTHMMGTGNPPWRRIRRKGSRRWAKTDRSPLNIAT